MTLARFTACALLLFGAGTSVAAPQPLLERQGQDRLLLARLPPILAEEEVERQLRTGLTTSFDFRLDLPGEPGGSAAGGARVEIRYELWDEEFLVRVLHADGEIEDHVLSSKDELELWWRELQVVLFASRRVEGGIRARVSLEVVPFSRSEQLDAQRWLSDSVSRGESTGGRGEGESLGRVFSILIATSIQRRPLSQVRWNLTTPPEEEP